MNLQEYQDKLTRQTLKQVADSQVRAAEYKEVQAQMEAARATSEAESAVIVKERLGRQTANLLRPTTTIRPELHRDGNGWAAVYYDVVGRGPTPELACQDFDNLWVGRE